MAGNLLGFTGREWDADAKLSYHRARWYDPQAGRFASEDPLGHSAGDANFYRYAGNNPISHTDPMGLSTRSVLPADPLAGGYATNLYAASFAPQRPIVDVSRLFRNEIPSEQGRLGARLHDVNSQLGALPYGDSAERRELLYRQETLRKDVEANSREYQRYSGGDVDRFGSGLYMSYSSAVGSGFVTSGKVFANTGWSTVTLGFGGDLIGVTDWDRAIGYNQASIGLNVALAATPGALATRLGNVRYGTQILHGLNAWDTLGNASSVVQGGADVYRTGQLTWQNSLQLAGGIGLAANVSSFRTLTEKAPGGTGRFHPIGEFGSRNSVPLTTGQRVEAVSYARS